MIIWKEKGNRVRKKIKSFGRVCLLDNKYWWGTSKLASMLKCPTVWRKNEETENTAFQILAKSYSNTYTCVHSDHPSLKKEKNKINLQYPHRPQASRFLFNILFPSPPLALTSNFIYSLSLSLEKTLPTLSTIAWLIFLLSFYFFPFPFPYSNDFIILLTHRILSGKEIVSKKWNRVYSSLYRALLLILKTKWSYIIHININFQPLLVQVTWSLVSLK